MGAPAKSISPESQKALGNRVRLTLPGQGVQIRQGVWSQGPVYKQLDADFLQRPLIPKAPLTPKLSIDNSNGSLRVIDPINNPAFSDVPDTMSLPQVGAALTLSERDPSRTKFQLIAVIAGFAAGLAAALILGWL